MPELNEATTAIEMTETCQEASRPAKRGKKSGKKRTEYFGEEQEDAFMRYVQSTDMKERNKIFRDVLYPAFTTMIESIIRRYNLFTPSEDFEDTFHDTMSFMITKVNNYDISRGKKVYSYCGTVCKHYLLYKRTQYARQQKKFMPYDPTLNWDDSHPEDFTDEETLALNSEVIEVIVKKLQDIVDNPESDLTPNELKIASALLFLLSNWEDLFVCAESRKFNKTSVLFFIKESTKLSTSEVRDAMRKFKNLYYTEKQNVIQN